MYNCSSFRHAVASIYLQLERLFDQPVKSKKTKQNKIQAGLITVLLYFEFPLKDLTCSSSGNLGTEFVSPIVH